ncbi:hypothetical protein B0T17DRAFT_491101 [Bombardia bombarda]|uniref:Uncharacterized protein n=1 Tax=Bombardia bombarda TaxID=252184 RepID=A0AA39X7J4_9PEZI|nr:hypothetical protein B0T17DRAFT_491101 [Bombardia bombarda]
MGHTSKFSFPIPGRRHKQAAAVQPPLPPPPPPSSQQTGHLTKAQRILGTGQISIDSPTPSADSKWTWDAKSNSAISIAVSETTLGHIDGGSAGLGIVHEGEVSGPSARRREVRWDDESEIIPRGYNRQSSMQVGEMGHDMTDASSLRRRQSNSTISSYYDKSKQPLSISQQTSNSAMAKGVPSKVQALLDVNGSLEPKKEKKKKPAMLDLSYLLSKSRSQKHLKPDPAPHHFLGPDMITKSPSVISLSPDPSQAPSKHRRLGRKATKESLRDVPPAQEAPSLPQAPPPPSKRQPPATANLHNLYDHYERRSFVGVMGEEEEIYKTQGSRFATISDPQDRSHPMPLPKPQGTAFLSPFPAGSSRMSHVTAKQHLPTGIQDMSQTNATSPLSMTCPPTDSASISSRHTRTSKASKRTDRSLTDLDLQKNSVLSLSSDSEDGSYEPSSKSSLAVPPLSDGQTSPTSPRSAMSQRSATSSIQDVGRGKQPKRTSFATSPQFLPIPEGAASTNQPKSSTRLGTLLPSTAPDKPLPPKPSRPSISTLRGVSYGTMQSISTHEAKAIRMVPGPNPAQHSNWPASGKTPEFENFPAPPLHRAQRPSIASRNSDHPTPPLSPSSVDFYLQSQRTSLAAGDSGSIHSENSRHDSSSSIAKGGRRSSTTSSMQDNNGGRFMAVTRQEEMLLAALRLKRARMREDIIAEFEEDLDRDDHTLDRRATNESSNSSSRMSRQSSASTMRTMETGALGVRPQQHQQPQIRITTGSRENLKSEKISARGQILLMLDRPVERDMCETAEPTPDLSEFLDFDSVSEEFPSHNHAVWEAERRGSKTSSRSSSKKSAGKAAAPVPRGQRVPLSINTAVSNDKSRWREGGQSRPNSEDCSPKSAPRRADTSEPQTPALEDLVEEDELDHAVRPESPISPSAFPVPMAMTRKKQVRLSAVGTGSFKPINPEAGWWDDRG